MIETEIEGDPIAVRAAGTWLRDTLSTRTATAADLGTQARSRALSSWEGGAAEGYRTFTGELVGATDEHAERIGRAATAFDLYATHLTTVQGEAAEMCSRASAGGLQVSGTTIAEPPSVPAETFEAGSPEEAAHQAAVDKVMLFNGLAEETIGRLQTHSEWVDTHLVPAVEDAEEKGGWAEFGEGLAGQWHNVLGGAAAGLGGLALSKRSKDIAGEAAEFERRSRVSGDPRVRGGADTPSGRSFLDDLRGKARWLGKLGKLMGPVGIGIDLGFGVKDGIETGDWTRAALTTGASIATGVVVAVAIASLPITGPALLIGAGTVVVAGLAAAGVSAGVGYVYDNWDDISEWGGDRVGDVKDFAEDVGDAASGAWDKVTPW